MAVSTDKIEVEGFGEHGLLEPVAPDKVVFDGEGAAVPLDGSVAEGQLIEEVYAALGDRDAFQVITTGSDDGVTTLHVLGDADLDEVKAVVAAHVPDPDFGLSKADIEVRDLRDKLRSGQDLKVAELNVVLRAFLG